MRIQLSTGEAHVWVWFGKPWFRGRRTTTVVIRLPDHTQKSATAECSTKDRFCRKVGRKEALRKLLYPHKMLASPTGNVYPVSGIFNKSDRRAIWQAVCPDLNRGRNNERTLRV